MPIAVRSSAGSTPADQATVRRLNLSLLLRNLAVGGARSRARLAQDTGLPVGLQIMAPALADDRLYRVGAAYEAARGALPTAV